MTNKYMMAVMATKTREFRVDFECTINSKTTESKYLSGIKRSGIKIDTGAHHTLIPLKTLGWAESEIDKIADIVISENIKNVSIIHGVENNNTENIQEIRRLPLEEIKKYKGLLLKAVAERMNIGGLDFNESRIGITTSTEGNILLGMDILSQMDIHIGKSKVTGCITLLACPYCSINVSAK